MLHFDWGILKIGSSWYYPGPIEELPLFFGLSTEVFKKTCRWLMILRRTEDIVLIYDPWLMDRRVLDLGRLEVSLYMTYYKTLCYTYLFSRIGEREEHNWTLTEYYKEVCKIKGEDIKEQMKILSLWVTLAKYWVNNVVALQKHRSLTKAREETVGNLLEAHLTGFEKKSDKIQLNESPGLNGVFPVLLLQRAVTTEHIWYKVSIAYVTYWRNWGLTCLPSNVKDQAKECKECKPMIKRLTKLYEEHMRGSLSNRYAYQRGNLMKQFFIMDIFA